MGSSRGHREPGKIILDTAKIELYEETGAIDFKIWPVCVYSVIAKDNFNRIRHPIYREIECIN